MEPKKWYGPHLGGFCLGTTGLAGKQIHKLSGFFRTFIDIFNQLWQDLENINTLLRMALLI